MWSRAERKSLRGVTLSLLSALEMMFPLMKGWILCVCVCVCDLNVVKSIATRLVSSLISRLISWHQWLFFESWSLFKGKQSQTFACCSFSSGKICFVLYGLIVHSVFGGFGLLIRQKWGLWESVMVLLWCSVYGQNKHWEKNSAD